MSIFPPSVRPLLYNLSRQVGVYGSLRRLKSWADRNSGRRLVPESALTACCRDALSLLKRKAPDEPLGDYLEFGCHGPSLAAMYRALDEVGAAEVRLFGFDSFEGLPASADADDGGHWEPGQFGCSVRWTRRFLTRKGVDWNRVVLVKGWFRDTLTDDLRRRHRLNAAGVIMIDCDMYESTREALTFCAPLIRERAVVLFDDWADLADRNLGEKRAFEEFLGTNPEFVAEELPSYADYAKVFLVTRRRSPV